MSYLEDIQKDLKKKDLPSGRGSGAILESIEAVHLNKAKEIATFICDGWSVYELDFLANYRMKYHQENGGTFSPFPLTQWNKTTDVEEKRSLLLEAVTKDILETESMEEQEDGGSALVMEMFNQRYGIKELEIEQKRKVEKANSYRFWLIFCISGLFFFSLLFIPAYLRSCAKFCSLNDCSSLSSFCSPYSFFFDSNVTQPNPLPAFPDTSSVGTPDDEFHRTF